jgi:hypothetical protein
MSIDSSDDQPDKSEPERADGENRELTPEDLEAIRHHEEHPEGPFIPSEVVRAHMQEWQEEWDRLGGFDMEYMRKFHQMQMERDQPLLVYHVRRKSATNE